MLQRNFVFRLFGGVKFDIGQFYSAGLRWFAAKKHRIFPAIFRAMRFLGAIFCQKHPFGVLESGLLQVLGFAERVVRHFRVNGGGQ